MPRGGHGRNHVPFLRLHVGVQVNGGSGKPRDVHHQQIVFRQGKEHLGVIHPSGRVHQHDRAPFLLKVAQLGKHFPFPHHRSQGHLGIAGHQRHHGLPHRYSHLVPFPEDFLGLAIQHDFVLRGYHLVRRERGRYFLGTRGSRRECRP